MFPVAARGDEVDQLEFGEVELEAETFGAWEGGPEHVVIQVRGRFNDRVANLQSGVIVNVSRCAVVKEFVCKDEVQESAERGSLW